VRRDDPCSAPASGLDRPPTAGAPSLGLDIADPRFGAHGLENHHSAFQRSKRTRRALGERSVSRTGRPVRAVRDWVDLPLDEGSLFRPSTELPFGKTVPSRLRG
jgi:hypothetical protein